MKVEVLIDTSAIKKMDKLIQAKAPKAIKSAMTRALKAGASG